MDPKIKRRLIIGGVILAVAASIIFSISSITEYLVEKYDEKYTGRRIEIGRVYVNPLTGYFYFSDFKCYELKSDSLFLSAKGLSINIALFHLFSKNYEISELVLNQPKGIIIQNKKNFNFADLVDKFSPNEQDTIKDPLHFNVLNVKINDGEFYYREENTPIDYYIKKVNFESTGVWWDVDTIVSQFSFESGPGSGGIKADYTLNIRTLDYRLAAVANKFDLQILEQYMRDMSNYGNFSANLDADIRATGNLKHPENLTSTGVLAVNDFHFGKTSKEDYASFDKLMIAMKKVSPKNHIYSYDSISLSHPYFKYERYDHLDNLQRMFGKEGSNVWAAAANPEKFNLIIEIARYARALSKNFFRSNYQINRVAVYNAHIYFDDFSPSEKFSIGLSSLNVFADSINKSRKRVSISFKSDIKPYGAVSLNLSVNPKDSTDFEMQYNFEELSAAMFNPYIVSSTSFTLDRGTLEFKGNWRVKNGIIQSTNHLLVIDPRTARRIRNKDTKWIPMPLVLSFIRERGNIIDYEIPITGNLKDPKFRLRDVVTDLFKNIFVKPPTIPYRIRVQNVESEIEQSLTLKWEMRQSTLQPEQEKFINRMADFLQKNPGTTLDLYPKTYTEKEKEHIALFEAKKKYFLHVSNKSAANFSEDDSVKISLMSAKDVSLVRYLDKQLNDSMLFTIQDKCLKFIGENILQAKFKLLNKKRIEVIDSFFKEGNVSKQVRIHDNESSIPYNGFSFLKITYKGPLPEALSNAYEKMNELDNETPRKEYKEERGKNKISR